MNIEIMYNTQYRQQNIRHFNCSRGVTRSARINWGILLGTQETYWPKPGGVTLIESTQIRKFSDDQAVEAGPCYRRQSLNTSSSDHKARDHSYQMVLMMARQGAGPCEQRPNSRVIFS
jgi:hypothetical protein